MIFYFVSYLAIWRKKLCIMYVCEVCILRQVLELVLYNIKCLCNIAICLICLLWLIFWLLYKVLNWIIDNIECLIMFWINWIQLLVGNRIERGFDSRADGIHVITNVGKTLLSSFLLTFAVDRQLSLLQWSRVLSSSLCTTQQVLVLCLLIHSTMEFWYSLTYVPFTWTILEFKSSSMYTCIDQF